MTKSFTVVAIGALAVGAAALPVAASAEPPDEPDRTPAAVVRQDPGPAELPRVRPQLRGEPGASRDNHVQHDVAPLSQRFAARSGRPPRSGQQARYPPGWAAWRLGWGAVNLLVG
jgi:hypothetical protein